MNDGTPGGRGGGCSDPPGSLGSGSSADHGRRPGPGAIAGPGADTGSDADTATGPERADHPDWLRGSRRDPGTRRSAALGERRDPRRRVERPDHHRPAARRRSAGDGCHRGLARPLAQFRPGRGGRPWRSARMAGGHHPGDPRRRAGHRRCVAGRALGGPARPGSARRAPRHHGSSGRHRRSAGSPRRARPAVGDAVHRAGAARSHRRLGECRGRIDRAPPGARSALVDPPRARHRRPAHGGAGRPEPLRPAGAPGDAPDPLRGRRRA